MRRRASATGPCAGPSSAGRQPALHPDNIGCRSSAFITQAGQDVILVGFLRGRAVFAAAVDAAGSPATWGLRSNHVREHNGQPATSRTHGDANTLAIVAAVRAGLGDHKESAALLCAERGDGGWYVPARDELNLLWQASQQQGGPIDLSAVGIDTSGRWYWTSTETYRYMAWVPSFRTGRQDVAYTRVPQLVRCVCSAAAPGA